MEDRSDRNDGALQGEEQLRKKITELTKELETTKSELNATRYEMRLLSRTHENVLEESRKVQVRLARAAQDSNDSYYAKTVELIEAKDNFRKRHESQRAEMGDERRVAEDRLESIIRDKLDIISSQIEELREVKEQLAGTKSDQAGSV